MRFLHLIRLVVLAGSHVILLFFLAWLIGSLLFAFSFVTAALLLASIALEAAYLFVMKMRNSARNPLFTFLSILLLVTFILYLAGVEGVAHESYAVLSGIFSSFLGMLVVLVLVPLFPIVVIVMTFFALKGLARKVLISFEAAFAFFYYAWLLNYLIQQQLVAGLVSFLVNAWLFYFGGLVLLHIIYLVDEDEAFPLE